MTHDNTTPARELLTLEGYMYRTGVTERTVRRWLAAGELPGARMIAGAWAIPADAKRTPPKPTGEVVTLTRQETGHHPAGTQRPAFDLDQLPSFLTLEQAAHLLSSADLKISPYAIAKNRDYFDVVPFGPNGSLVVPLATIKRIRG